MCAARYLDFNSHQCDCFIHYCEFLRAAIALVFICLDRIYRFFYQYNHNHPKNKRRTRKKRGVGIDNFDYVSFLYIKARGAEHHPLFYLTVKNVANLSLSNTFPTKNSPNSP